MVDNNNNIITYISGGKNKKGRKINIIICMYRQCATIFHPLAKINPSIDDDGTPRTSQMIA